MNVADFDYQLPPELIAQFPPKQRTAGRLLHLSQDGTLHDRLIPDMAAQLRAGDLLVLNDTKVIPARLHGRKDTGGRIEVLLERIIDAEHLLVQIRSSKAPKVGQLLVIDGAEQTLIEVIGRQDSFFELSIQLESGTDIDLTDWFEEIGHMPLPPYINRDDQAADNQRYQTVFANQHGAVAAPTAGLHYDQELLSKIEDKGVEIATVTLHVGAGTYQPVRVETLAQHKMHSEWLSVDASVCDKIIATKRAGGRVVAVGTTVVRSLETAARASSSQLIEPFEGETDIFIYPGFEFKVVDLLQTNFHLPQSTLLMLVSAFSGQDRIRAAYQHAIEHAYRFFSYGDAMLLEREPPAE